LKHYPSFQTSIDLSNVVLKDTSDYVSSVHDKVKANVGIKDLYPNNNPELVKLLSQMLEFNPYFRPSAKQLLKNKIFDEIRNLDNEKRADFKIKISADKNVLASDYENDEDKKDL
jgi:serine/threonine protein kinase